MNLDNAWKALAMAVLPVTLTAVLTGCGGDDDDPVVRDTRTPLLIEEAFLNEQASQIGGDTTAVNRFSHNGSDWVLFNIAHKLMATPVTPSRGATYQVTMDAYINDIDVVELNGARYALLAVDGAGIAVVNITDPLAMSVLNTVAVNYYQDGISFAEGGGDILTDQVIEGTGTITSLVTDGTSLWIGNEDYGIHKTALVNVLGSSPATEPDGTLLIETEAYTVQYAGEHGWGGPKDLQLHDGNLYAAQGFLGVGVYDPDTLTRVGHYNLYTDTSVAEDWFVNLDVSTQVQGPDYIDPDTGMPNYKQASFEILEVWHNGADAPTPWADFDRYGKFYYDARTLDVADFSGDTRVFVAYGLGGVVALDANDPASLSYLGYAPAVPAHGPDKPRNEKSQSLFPYFGAGMLKEAGVVDVQADPANNRLFYTDHFAGLGILAGADDPATNWQQAGAPHDNDSNDDLGDHFPDYEFVTSYDMSGYDPEDNETLPAWMYEAPSSLITGEISGHGNAFTLMPTLDNALGNVDVALGNGAGGMDFIDLGDLNEANMGDRFAVTAHYDTTDKIGAAADGTATAGVSIGHTQGVVTTGRYLYVSDGPHGMMVFQIADESGNPIDNPHVVANTIDAEYPVDPGTGMVYPTPHAWNNVLNDGHSEAFVLSQSLGLRRVDISGVESGLGAPGMPLLLTPQPSDFYEHNLPTGSFGGISRQDHAYDVALHGDYAIVADGSNGLTVYDLTADPSDGTGSHVVANLGASTGSKPLLGRPTGVELWSHPSTDRIYAFVAAGHAGIGVVDMTELLVNGTAPGMELVKIFEPIKYEEEADGTIHVGKADARSVDVDIVQDHAYFSYGGFGIVAYSIADLLEPLPDGVEPDKIWKTNDFDHRPEAVGHFRLQDLPGMEGTDPEALYMTTQYYPANYPLTDDSGETYTLSQPRLLIYASFGGEGAGKIDWSDPANPVLLQHQDTVGEATGTAIAHGRVYVSDHEGGLVIFRP